MIYLNGTKARATTERHECQAQNGFMRANERKWKWKAKKRYRRSQAHAVNEYFAINYLFNVIGCWKTDHKFGCNVEFAFYKYHSGIWSKFYFFMFTGFWIWQIPQNRTWSQSFWTRCHEKTNTNIEITATEYNVSISCFTLFQFMLIIKWIIIVVYSILAVWRLYLSAA